MQIPMGNKRRVDFHGNAKEGVYVQIVNEEGITFVTKKLTEEERNHLIYMLTRQDNGRAV